jgi:hypothetical protein
MLTVISGILVTPFALATSLLPRTLTFAERSRYKAQPLHLAPMSSSAKADDPVFRAASVQFWRHGVLDARFRGHDELS